MTAQGAELLALVYASPEVDAHRLVYADWLIAQGDPRGEFITLQFKREAGHASVEDMAREHELVRAHARDWMGALAPVVNANTAAFRKGFLSACTARFRSNKQRDALCEAPEWATVETLSANSQLLSRAPLRSLRVLGPVTTRTLSEMIPGRTLPAVEQLQLNVRNWSEKFLELVWHVLPNVRRLELWYADTYTDNPRDFQPEKYASLFNRAHCDVLASLAIRRRVLISYPQWLDYANPRPDLGRWMALVRGCTNTVSRVRLEPCHGWAFSLVREGGADAVARAAEPPEAAQVASPAVVQVASPTAAQVAPSGWRLDIDWHTNSASADPKNLQLVMSSVSPSAFERVRVCIHGVVRDHHYRILERHLQLFQPLDIEVSAAAMRVA